MSRLIKYFLMLAAALTAYKSFAAEGVYLPNMKAFATGTSLGAGHTGLDVSGSLSVTNPSTGAAVPATANYVAGNKGGVLTGLLIGQQTMANSLGVTLSSDQSALSTSRTWSLLNTTDSVNAVQSGAWNITNISGTISLPTGAATSANQTTENASLSSIDGKLGSLGQKTMTGSAPVVIASDQSAIPLAAGSAYIGQVGMLPGSQNTFGETVTTARRLQISAQFMNGSTLANILTLTNSGGGSSSSISSGMAQFVTGATGTAQAKGVTPQSVTYTTGQEVFSEFTASFTTPNSANTYQRIGLYDTNNGFFVSYEGLNFGICTRNTAVDTCVVKASFNKDTLVGAAGSLFTRAGTPEAIDLTKLNVFRIRFGWLGAAPINYEVLSPDGKWVTFHTIYQPNLAAAPSVQSPNLPMTVDVNKSGGGGLSLVLSTACWGAGTTGTDSVMGYSAGSIQNTAVNSTTEASTAVPANVVGMIIQAESPNTTNIRWALSGSSANITSSGTLGILMEPGRDTGYIPVSAGGFLHYAATSAGTNKLAVQWITSQ